MNPQTGNAIECLLADNNLADVQLVRDALPAIPVPLHLRVVDTGEQALALLRQSGKARWAPQPDMLLLAQGVAHASGQHLLATLKSDPALKNLPVFVTLETMTERLSLQQQGLHPEQYLLKPITAPQLLRALRHRSLRTRVLLALQQAAEASMVAQTTIDRTHQLRQDSAVFRQHRRAWAELRATHHTQTRSTETVSYPAAAALGMAGSSFPSEMNFLQMADTMREELHSFFHLVYRGANQTALTQAAMHLQQVLNRYEPLIQHPHLHGHSSQEQHWGFLRLLTFVQSARDVLRKLPMPQQ